MLVGAGRAFPQRSPLRTASRGGDGRHLANATGSQLAHHTPPQWQDRSFRSCRSSSPTR
jgi:hypothetical protein